MFVDLNPVIDNISAHEISQGFATDKIFDRASLLFEFPLQEGMCKKNKTNVPFHTRSSRVWVHIWKIIRNSNGLNK